MYCFLMLLPLLLVNFTTLKLNMLATTRILVSACDNALGVNACLCRKLTLTAACFQAQFKHLARKEKKKSKEGKKSVYLYGPTSCYAALKSGRRKITKLYLNESFANESLSTKNILHKTITEAEMKGVPISYVTKSHLNNLVRVDSDKSSDNDVVLKSSVLKCRDLGTDLTPNGYDKVWLALDRIQDPMNLGSIIRTCWYYGVSRIVVSEKDTCSLTPVASFASNGTVEWFPTYSAPSMEKFLKEATKAGWNTLATTGPENEKFAKPVYYIDRLTLDRPSILVVGSEGYGLTDGVVESCSHLVTVSSFRHKMPKGLDSLNVSAATGVLLHSLLGNSYVHTTGLNMNEKQALYE